MLKRTQVLKDKRTIMTTSHSEELFISVWINKKEEGTQMSSLSYYL